jgi:xanthine dehydrogenase YagR molybdenum-binding subunit
MKFDTPATTNPIDQLKVIGRATDRIDGPKTTGTAPYAYEHNKRRRLRLRGRRGHRQGPHHAMDVSAARRAPGVLAMVTADNAGKLGKGNFNTAKLLGGPQIQHYHQAIALVVARPSSRRRRAAGPRRVQQGDGAFDLARADAPSRRRTRKTATTGRRLSPAPSPRAGAARRQLHHARPVARDDGAACVAGRVEGRQAHALDLEPDDRLGQGRHGQDAGHPEGERALVSPYIGGGFGGKLFLRAEALLAALGAAAAGRPVKVALQRPLMMNNTTHRPATIQRIRIGASRDGKIRRSPMKAGPAICRTASRKRP